MPDGDPTGWFEQFYSAGADGRIAVPWSRTEPHALLAAWTAGHQPDGRGRRALVVGCALGADAEHVAGFGYETTAFDVSETAIRLAGERFPGSAVRYGPADLLDPPPSWRHGFDLVVEVITVQALPRQVRRAAISNVASFVAPGGTLIVIAAADDGAPPRNNADPWPLSRGDIDSFTADGLSPVTVEQVPSPGQPGQSRWFACFRRSPGGGPVGVPAGPGDESP